MPHLPHHLDDALLRLLFSLDNKSFASIKSAFFTSFPQQEDRVKACCAALLLLEDSRALSTAQRLGTWFLLCVGWTGSHGESSCMPQVTAYLVAVVGDERRSAVERSLVLQLLQPEQLHQLQLDCCTPLDYALRFSLPLANPSSSNGSSTPTVQPADAQLLDKLQQQHLPMPLPTTPAQLDQLLQQQRQVLVALAGGHLATTSNGSSATLAAGPANGTALCYSRRGTPASGSEVSSTPNTPSKGFGAATPAPSPLKPGGLDVDDPAALITSQRLSLSGPPSGSTFPVPSLSANNHTQGADSSRSSATLHLNGALDHGSAGSDAASNEAASIPEEQLAHVKELVERALSGPLMPAQQAQVLRALADHPSVLSACGVGPQHLPALVEHTPGVAVELLLRLAGSAQLPNYLAVLALSDMSLHGMEVVNRLTTSMELPTEFLQLYITNCIHTCEGTKDKYVQSRHVRLLCVFLQSLIRNRVVHITDLLHEVQSFCVNFSRIREAAKLFRLLKQIESGGRLGGSDGQSSPTAGSGVEGGDGNAEPSGID